MLRAIALCLLAWVGGAAYAPRLPPHRSSSRRAVAFATVAAEPAAPAPSVYSPTARANLRHAVVTEPLDEAGGETAPDRSQRWKYRLTGLVFAAIKRTPLYGKIKRKALEKMVASAESTGLKWDLSVRELNEAGATAQSRLDAIIAEVSAELGEWVTPSAPLIAAPDLIDAIDPTSLYVSAPMDETEAARLEADQPVRVTIDSHPGASFPGRIVRVAPYVLDLEQQNRTVEVEVELEDAEFAATLLPGTSADVEVVLGVREDVVRLPVLALFEGDRAFVVEADGTISIREVEIGLRNWRYAEVTAGITTGERVVIHFEVDELVDGELVGVLGEAAE